jgi:dTDP-4-dehydrorhamnose 3,5-epimerase
MIIEQTTLPGVLLLQPKRFSDERGYFYESWQQQRYAEIGIPNPFVQDNVSRSSRGVLRGLHFQNPKPQGKLVSVHEGEVFDVAIDIRSTSKAFGKWFGIHLSAENGRQLWIPEGFAHGFLVTSASAIFSYKCTDYYSPQAENSLRWNDPDLAIAWPAGDKILSPKDQAAPLLKDVPKHQLSFAA